MNGRGGCCIARYAGGVHDISKVDRIMLRFRPIAPKPPAATDGFFSGAATTTTPESSELSFVKTNGRKKRRNSKDGHNNNNSNNGSLNKRCGARKRKSSSEETTSVVKTLPLLPETPDVKESLKRGANLGFHLWLSSGNEYRNGGGYGIGHGTGHVMEDAPAAVRRRVAVSWVKVESVTDNWVTDCYGHDNVGLGRTDEEKVMSLELDTCPGFVSDSVNSVRWTNAAYKRMVAAEEAKEVVVGFVVEEGVEIPADREAFTCRVRVIGCGKEKNYLTLPCDVWRMKSGGFAWRLDTKAALSLGW